MNEFEATVILVGLMALRCITPIIIVFTIGYVTNHLLNRWQVQDEG